MKGDNMNDKFLEAMTDQSLLMMKKACAGETLTKEEINFILLTQRLSEKNEKKQILPILINNSQRFLPLISSLFTSNKEVTKKEENINE